MNHTELHDRDHDVRTERTAVAEARGAAHFARLMARRPDEALSAVRAASPQMYAWLVNGPFAGPLSGSELTMGQRELATVAVLVALGDSERQLAAHTAAALSQGITATELRGIPLHVSVYAGLPRALNALTVIDRVLAEAGTPAPPSLRRVLLGDHGTTVAQAGVAGPPVVLVHALGLDWRMWEPVIAQLAAGRRVYAYDVRGHGSATEAPRPSCMNDLATDLLAVLDALGLDRAHVVGLSYGGGIVQTAATLAPERFESMTLMATTNVGVRGLRGPGALDRARRHGCSGGALTGAVVHLRCPRRQRLGGALRPRLRAARRPRACRRGLAGVPDPRRRKGSSPGSAPPPSCWPVSGTRPPRRRSCPGSRATSPARATRRCREHRTCRPSSSPPWS